MKAAIAPLFASLAVAAACGAPNASAAYRCDNPGDVGDRRACAYAAEGPDALRRFIQRTQGIYILDYRDYLRPADEGVATRTRRTIAAAANRATASRPR